MASVPCALGCGNPVNPHDMQTWKQIKGWVHGKKRDSLTMREDTGEYAHDHCVRALKDGQDPAQKSMFDDEQDAVQQKVDEGGLEDLFS